MITACIFLAWWLTFLGATGLLVCWQWRLAQRRTATWDTQLAYVTATATVAVATVFVFLVAALILALMTPAPVGRVLGIVVLAAWGCQCRDRWLALGSGGGPGLGKRMRQLVGVWPIARQHGRG